MNTQNDFLLEILTEELPPNSLNDLATVLKNEIVHGLEKKQILFSVINEFATPRRLAIIINNLEPKQKTQEITKRGPSLNAAFTKDGAPTPAAVGFAQSCNIDINKIRTIKTEQGEFLFYQFKKDGEETDKLLPEIINDAIQKLPIPRLMRWGDHDIEFARPVHSVILLYGSRIISAKILGQIANNITRGHRFLSTKPIIITEPKYYVKLLEENFVIADFEKRKEIIKKQIEKIAHDVNGTIMQDDNLLNYVTSVTEWPVALLAKFPEKYLHVPKECLISSITQHQKCFPVLTITKKLLPFFITITNLISQNSQSIITGNEKVMNARLCDAEFFYLQDLQVPLINHVEQLKYVIFEASLGSMFAKTERLQILSNYIAKIWDQNSDYAKRAAYLSKADLLTKMVGEFPELQGIMGGYYAKHAHEAAQVSQAITEHYSPKSAEDKIPENIYGQVLAIAHRIDNLVGFFGINKQPTGEKDPFALRRSALGIVRILIEGKHFLNINSLIETTINAYNKLINENSKTEIYEFIFQRLKFWLLEKNFSSEIFLAIFANKPDDIYDFYLRAEAIKKFMQIPEAEILIAINKRVKNILQKQNYNYQHNHVINKNLLTEKDEIILVENINAKNELINDLYLNKDYTNLLFQLITFSEFLNNFFANVMVMVDDSNLKNNRLLILAKLNSMFAKIADISLLK